jgi:hypothetical protein
MVHWSNPQACKSQESAQGFSVLGSAHSNLKTVFEGLNVLTPIASNFRIRLDIHNITECYVLCLAFVSFLEAFYKNDG